MRGTVRIATVLIVVAGLLATIQPSASAASLTVPSGAFPTIQDAVDAANPGDVIKIKPGTYNEDVDITTDDIRITSTKKRGVLIDPFNAIPLEHPGVAFHATATNVQIDNLSVRNGEAGDIRCEGDGCVIKNVTFKNSLSDDCLLVEGSDAVVSGVSARACSDKGIEIDGDDATVQRSSVGFTDSGCIDIEGNGARVEENVVRNCEDSSGGVFVRGENPVVEYNTAIATDDEGFDVECIDDTGGGFPAGEACSIGAVKKNVARDISDDDDGYEIDVEVGTGYFLVTGNRAENVNQYGFDISMSGGEISKNVSIGSGSEDEDGFEIDGADNEIRENSASLSGGSGFEIDGNDNTIIGNKASKNARDGLNVGGLGNSVTDNSAKGNDADGIENEGTDTVMTGNTSSGNKLDCSNDGGTFAVGSPSGNSCADGSDFTTTTGIDT